MLVLNQQMQIGETAKPPGNKLVGILVDGGREGRTHQREEKRAVLRIGVVVDAKQHHEAGDSDRAASDQEKEAVLEAVGGDGEDHGDNPCDDPDGDGTELGLDGGGGPLVDDGGGEVGETVGRNEEAEVHDCAGHELQSGVR